MKRPYPKLFAKDFKPHPDDDEAVKKLAEKYKHTRFKLNPKGRVWSVSQTRLSDLDCSILLRLPELIELNMGHIFGNTYSSFTHVGFAKLSTHPKIKAFLDCYNPMLGDEVAIVVGSSTRFRWVHLGGCGITNNGVRDICKAKQLLMLSIFNSEITDDVVQNLSELINLRHLNIRETKISRNSAMKLQKHLPRCKIDILLPKYAV